MDRLEASIQALKGFLEAAFPQHAVYTSQQNAVETPCFVVWWERAEPEDAAFGLHKMTHTVVADMLYKQNVAGVLAQATTELRPYVAKYRDVLQGHKSLGGNCDEVRMLPADRMNLVNSGVEYVGIRFRQGIKIKDAVATAP